MDLAVEQVADRVPLDLERLVQEKEIQTQLAAQPSGPNEPCKFFMRGNCIRGNNCPFAHQRNEKAVVCKHWLRGLCKKDDKCDFLHVYDLARMPECYFYSKFGECSNEDCLFRHIDLEVHSRECPWYDRGFCKHGPRCRYRHIKKKLCTDYFDGFCPLGPACKLSHPKWNIAREDDRSAQRTVETPRQSQQRRARSDRPGSKKGACFKCGEAGHIASQCPRGGGGRGGGRRSRFQQQPPPQPPPLPYDAYYR